MTNESNSYKQIFKATSLFGGVQLFNIIILIIKSKIVAVLLGPLGIGIVGLFSSTLTFITAITNFGLERSSVKNIAAANSTFDINRISTVVTILRKLVWITGLLGAIITLLFSSYLSEITFGNKEYTWSFILLSFTLLINQISAGQGVVLRGMQKINYMAKSSFYGSLIGLIVSVPIYYFLGINGIVPSLILSSITAFLLTFYFSSKINLNKVKISKKDFFLEGREMLIMGVILSLSTLLVLGESYIIRVYIRSIGSIEDVGFYTAGFAIVNTYFGVIFTALTTDYYPKLAGIAKDNNKAIDLMNQQSEMAILIISPILIIFLIFINLIVVLLYSNKFLEINEMILWGGLGIFFKAASWSLGVIFISKGDVKTLFWSEFFATLVLLLLNLLGYKYYKLDGLGISFFLSYLYAYIQTYLIVRYKYSFIYTYKFYKVFIVNIILGILAFLTVKFLDETYNYVIGLILIITSITFSFVEIDNRVDLKAMLKKKNNY